MSHQLIEPTPENREALLAKQPRCEFCDNKLDWYQLILQRDDAPGRTPKHRARALCGTIVGVFFNTEDAGDAEALTYLHEEVPKFIEHCKDEEARQLAEIVLEWLNEHYPS